MSIIRSCLRLSTVAALRSRTWAGTRVMDSPNLAIDLAMKAEPTPYIAVYTDDDARIGLGKQLDGQGRTIYLIVEFGVAAPIEQTEGGSGPSISIPAPTDEAFELIVDNLERQILYALTQDAESPWGAIWKSFTVRTDQVDSKRGGSADKGERWAARQLIFHLMPISDPVAGFVMKPTHPVQQFLTAARAAPDELKLRNIIDVIEAMATPGTVPDWKVAQGWLGISTRAVRDIGIAPAILVGDVEPAPLVTATPNDLGNVDTVPNDDYLNAQGDP